jgi:hypothetical protein
VLPAKINAVVQPRAAWSVTKILNKMDKFNRDLLVLFKEKSNQKSIEHEVELLHELLFYVEKIDNLVTSFEVVNINKYRISSNHKLVKETLGQRHLKPFVFLNNKN